MIYMTTVLLRKNDAKFGYKDFLKVDLQDSVNHFRKIF